ncbi:MAG: hypothetical protein IIX02_04300, partial [Clostridia bacterium]|nr:hypothetical protein [Clostridia bacterium]
MHAILFKDGKDSEGNPVKVPVTLKELDGDFINKIKIAEILGATEYDPENSMHAILFKDGTDSDGNPVKVPVTIDELDEDFINNIEIAGILGETEYDAKDPMHAILFKDGTDSEGNPIKVPVTIKELNGDFINNIEIAGILGETEYDAKNPMHAIIFKNGENGNKVPVTLNELDGEFINNIEIAGILGETEYNSDNAMHAILFKDGTDSEGNPVKIPVTLKELDETFINSVKLKDLFGKNSNEVLQSLLTITEVKDGVSATRDTTLADLTNADTSKILINSIKLSAVIEGNSNEVLQSLSTITEIKDGVSTTRPTTLADLTDPAKSQTLINSIKLEHVIETDGENAHAVLKAIVFTTDAQGNKVSRTLADLSNTETSANIINSIQLKDVIGENSNKVLQSLSSITELKDGVSTTRPTTLADLTNADTSQTLINSIKLEDVMDTSDAILRSIAYDESGNPRTLNDLATAKNSEKIIKGIKLADVLGVTSSSHKALIFLAYGSDTIDPEKARTLGEIRDAGNDLINDIPLSYIITPDLKDPVLSYLIYGTKGIHYDVETKTENGVTAETYKPLPRHIIIKDGKAHNEYGEELKNSANYTFTLNSENTKFTENNLVYTLTQGTRTKGEESITVYYLNDNAGNKVMFKEATLADFSAEDNAITKLTSRLTAKDILGDDIETNTMLKFLKDTPINKLGAEVEKLTFGQVFEDQIYRKNKNGEYIDLEGNVVSKENRVLGDIWHYMLTDENGNSAEFEYSIVNDMDKLTENMKREVHNATLNRLAHDGIIKFDGNTLEADIIAQIGSLPISFKDPNDTTNTGTDADYKKTAAQMFKNADGTAKQTVGELTVEEIIVYVDGVLNALKKVNGQF